MKRIFFSFTATLAFMVLLALAGCTQSEPVKPPAAAPTSAQTGHDHDDVPITEADVDMPATYAAAIPRIRVYRDTIRDRIAEGTPTKAHRALDELDFVLNKLPTIARESDVPKEHWKVVNTSAQELRGLFNELHSAIDAGKTPDYAAVGAKIDAAVERLADVAGNPAP